jgi:hypothetical protein
MKTALPSVLTRLAMVGAAATIMCLAGYMVGRTLSERTAARWEDYHGWLSTELPCLDDAVKIPSATVTAQFVADGGPNGPTAPEVTYLVPDQKDGYLLVAHFRLRIGKDNEPTDIERASYQCLNLQTTSLVPTHETTQRRYRGILLDTTSFAMAVAGVQKNVIPADISRRMESTSEDMGFWVPEYDPYARYLPTQPAR